MFLQTASAKLIMEHLSMIADFGRGNKMVKKLIESMMKAELAGNLGEAAQKLDHWSNVICKDYATKNNLLPNATDATLLEVVQQQSVIINQLVLSNGNMERQMEKQIGEIAALRETVQSQSTSMVTALTTSLMGAVQTVWHGYANNENLLHPLQTPM
jgi:tRNA A-37 threonylcarbamoyl transferase component Bud32